VLTASRTPSVTAISVLEPESICHPHNDGEPDSIIYSVVNAHFFAGPVAQLYGVPIVFPAVHTEWFEPAHAISERNVHPHSLG